MNLTIYHTGDITTRENNSFQVILQYNILILNSYMDYILREKRAKNIIKLDSTVLTLVEILVLSFWEYFICIVGYSK